MRGESQEEGNRWCLCKTVDVHRCWMAVVMRQAQAGDSRVRILLACLYSNSDLVTHELHSVFNYKTH